MDRGRNRGGNNPSGFNFGCDNDNAKFFLNGNRMVQHQLQLQLQQQQQHARMDQYQPYGGSSGQGNFSHQYSHFQERHRSSISPVQERRENHPRSSMYRGAVAYGWNHTTPMSHPMNAIYGHSQRGSHENRNLNHPKPLMSDYISGFSCNDRFAGGRNFNFESSNRISERQPYSSHNPRDEPPLQHVREDVMSIRERHRSHESNESVSSANRLNKTQPHQSTSSTVTPEDVDANGKSIPRITGRRIRRRNRNDRRSQEVSVDRSVPHVNCSSDLKKTVNEDVTAETTTEVKDDSENIENPPVPEVDERDTSTPVKDERPVEDLELIDESYEPEAVSSESMDISNDESAEINGKCAQSKNETKNDGAVDDGETYQGIKEFGPYRAHLQLNASFTEIHPETKKAFHYLHMRRTQLKPNSEIRTKRVQVVDGFTSFYQHRKSNEQRRSSETISRGPDLVNGAINPPSQPKPNSSKVETALATEIPSKSPQICSLPSKERRPTVVEVIRKISGKEAEEVHTVPNMQVKRKEVTRWDSEQPLGLGSSIKRQRISTDLDDDKKNHSPNGESGRDIIPILTKLSSSHEFRGDERSKENKFGVKVGCLVERVVEKLKTSNPQLSQSNSTEAQASNATNVLERSTNKEKEKEYSVESNSTGNASERHGDTENAASTESNQKNSEVSIKKKAMDGEKGTRKKRESENDKSLKNAECSSSAKLPDSKPTDSVKSKELRKGPQIHPESTESKENDEQLNQKSNSSRRQVGVGKGNATSRARSASLGLKLNIFSVVDDSNTQGQTEVSGTQGIAYARSSSSGAAIPTVEAIEKTEEAKSGLSPLEQLASTTKCTNQEDNSIDVEAVERIFAADNQRIQSTAATNDDKQEADIRISNASLEIESHGVSNDSIELVIDGNSVDEFGKSAKESVIESSVAESVPDLWMGAEEIVFTNEAADSSNLNSSNSGILVIDEDDACDKPRTEDAENQKETKTNEETFSNDEDSRYGEDSFAVALESLVDSNSAMQVVSNEEFFRKMTHTCHVIEEYVTEESALEFDSPVEEHQPVISVVDACNEIGNHVLTLTGPVILDNNDVVKLELDENVSDDDIDEKMSDSNLKEEHVAFIEDNEHSICSPASASEEDYNDDETNGSYEYKLPLETVRPIVTYGLMFKKLLAHIKHKTEIPWHHVGWRRRYGFQRTCVGYLYPNATPTDCSDCDDLIEVESISLPNPSEIEDTRIEDPCPEVSSEPTELPNPSEIEDTRIEDPCPEPISPEPTELPNPSEIEDTLIEDPCPEPISPEPTEDSTQAPEEDDVIILREIPSSRGGNELLSDPMVIKHEAVDLDADDTPCSSNTAETGVFQSGLQTTASGAHREPIFTALMNAQAQVQSALSQASFVSSQPVSQVDNIFRYPPISNAALTTATASQPSASPSSGSEANISRNSISEEAAEIRRNYLQIQQSMNATRVSVSPQQQTSQQTNVRIDSQTSLQTPANQVQGQNSRQNEQSEQHHRLQQILQTDQTLDKRVPRHGPAPLLQPQMHFTQTPVTVIQQPHPPPQQPPPPLQPLPQPLQPPPQQPPQPPQQQQQQQQQMQQRQQQQQQQMQQRQQQQQQQQMQQRQQQQKQRHVRQIIRQQMQGPSTAIQQQAHQQSQPMRQKQGANPQRHVEQTPVTLPVNNTSVAQTPQVVTEAQLIRLHPGVNPAQLILSSQIPGANPPPIPPPAHIATTMPQHITAVFQRQLQAQQQNRQKPPPIVQIPPQSSMQVQPQQQHQISHVQHQQSTQQLQSQSQSHSIAQVQQHAAIQVQQQLQQQLQQQQLQQQQLQQQQQQLLSSQMQQQQQQQQQQQVQGRFSAVASSGANRPRQRDPPVAVGSNQRVILDPGVMHSSIHYSCRDCDETSNSLEKMVSHVMASTGNHRIATIFVGFGYRNDNQVPRQVQYCLGCRETMLTSRHWRQHFITCSLLPVEVKCHFCNDIVSLFTFNFHVSKQHQDQISSLQNIMHCALFVDHRKAPNMSLYVSVFRWLGLYHAYVLISRAFFGLCVDPGEEILVTTFNPCVLIFYCAACDNFFTRVRNALKHQTNCPRGIMWANENRNQISTMMFYASTESCLNCMCCKKEITPLTRAGLIEHLNCFINTLTFSCHFQCKKINFVKLYDLIQHIIRYHLTDTLPITTDFDQAKRRVLFGKVKLPNGTISLCCSKELLKTIERDLSPTESASAPPLASTSHSAQTSSGSRTTSPATDVSVPRTSC